MKIITVMLLLVASAFSQEVKQSGAFSWFQKDQAYSIEVNVDPATWSPSA